MTLAVGETYRLLDCTVNRLSFLSQSNLCIVLGSAWNTLNMFFFITQNFISPPIRQHIGWCQYIKYHMIISANRSRSGNGGIEYDSGLLSLAFPPLYFMNMKGGLCWCQRFKTWNWPVRSGVSLSPFLCPEIDFADLALSLWNALGMCVCLCVCASACVCVSEWESVCECVCFTARTVYHMHTHTAGRGHLGLFSAERERGRAEPVERALIKMRGRGGEIS